jgi:hypothetical protein
MSCDKSPQAMSDNTQWQGDAKFVVNFMNPEIRAFNLGQGFNSLKGEASLNELSSCIDHEGASSVLNSQGASIGFSVSHLKSTSDLYSKLNRDISLNFGYKMEASQGSASVSQKTFNEMTLSSSYSYALITGQKVFTPVTLNSYRVPSEKLEFYSRHSELFYPNCGDSFVSSVSMGVELIALLECRTNSLEEKTRIDKVINLSSNGNIFDAKASLQHLIESTHKSTQAGCSIYVEAKGRGRVDLDISVDAFAQSAVNFILQGSIEDSVPVYYLTQDYSRVPNSEFKTNVLDKTDLNFTEQKRIAHILREKLNAYHSIVESNKSLLAKITDQDKNKNIAEDVKRDIGRMNTWRRELDALALNPWNFIENDDDWGDAFQNPNPAHNNW